MYFFTTFILLSFLSKLVVTVSVSSDPLSDAFINQINKEGKWVAGRNFHPDIPIEKIKKLLGVNVQDLKAKSKFPVKKHDKELIKNLPQSFDPRDKWPNCPSLNEIRDQGYCGSCWAFGTVEVLTDRVCTYSNGTKNFHFSAEDLVTCNFFDAGCDGGNPEEAWYEWVEEGFVSGGNYNSKQGCKPYSIATCPNFVADFPDFVPTPPCVRSCRNGYDVSYTKDKHYGRDVYTLEGEDDMKAELFNNGPITGVISVFEDFIHYKNGVYQHVSGRHMYGHAFKILGWGVENGTKYWLAANSWNTLWGDKGFFKFLRGVNECGIESYIIAGEPQFED